MFSFSFYVFHDAPHYPSTASLSTSTLDLELARGSIPSALLRYHFPWTPYWERCIAVRHAISCYDHFGTVPLPARFRLLVFEAPDFLWRLGNFRRYDYDPPLFRELACHIKDAFEGAWGHVVVVGIMAKIKSIFGGQIMTHGIFSLSLCGHEVRDLPLLLGVESPSKCTSSLLQNGIHAFSLIFHHVYAIVNRRTLKKHRIISLCLSYQYLM